MAIPLYLAMTAAEFSACRDLPQYPAWMSCHFSPGGQGLSNIPADLPEGCLLILDDQLPPSVHDPTRIRKQLQAVTESQNCAGLLLDFQRPEHPETERIAKELLQLPCQVCVSHWYAKDLSCPILLPPCPPTTSLPKYLAPWQEREVWLETAPEGAMVTVNRDGSHTAYRSYDGVFPFADTTLHCHYRIETDPDEVRFSLCRTTEDLSGMLQEAESLGVKASIGLYQELCP